MDFFPFNLFYYNKNSSNKFQLMSDPIIDNYKKFSFVKFKDVETGDIVKPFRDMKYHHGK